jgi:lipid A 3-O-deacylase
MKSAKLGAVLAAGVSLVALGVSGARAEEHGSFSILVENDVFYNTDRDYTAGQQLNYTTSPDGTPDGLVDTAHALSFLLPGEEVRSSFSIGQDIFTPADTKSVIPPLSQRPYAGFLYASVGLLASDKDKDTLNQLNLQLGVIGPDSLAQDAQDFVHSILGERKPAGWAYQLHNEPALELTYGHSFKLIDPQTTLGHYFDVEPNIGAAVGNVYDYANAGAMARVGFNLPNDFGPLRMEPALPGSSYFEPSADLSAYVFGGVDGRIIGRNIFLDGNTFESSRHVDKIPYTVDFETGAAIAFRAFRLSFTHVFRTKEYHGQPHSDQFGAVNLTVRL